MTQITISNFQGTRPKVAADLLPPSMAQDAINAKITNGQLRAWFDQLIAQEAVNTGTIQAIYYYLDTYWLEWEADVDVVEGPVSSDTIYKLYFTGHGIPKKTAYPIAITGSGAPPIDFYPLGVPAPVKAIAGVVGTGGVGDPRAMNYAWTIVTSWGEEGAPSPASATVVGKNGQSIALSNMSMQWTAGATYAAGDTVVMTSEFVLLEDGIGHIELEGGGDIRLEGASDEDPTGYMFRCVTAGVASGTEPTWNTTVDGDTVDGGVTWRCYKNNMSYKRLYRLNTGKESAQYQFLTQINFEATTYTDTTADRNLAEVIPSTNYDQPPDTLRGLVYLSNGITAGFDGKDILFSESYRPWAWPIGYRLAIGSPVVGIESLGGELVAGTEGRPFICVGTDPAAMTPIRLPDPHACVSKRSMAAYQEGVIYAGPDGLYMVSAGKTQLLTANHYSVEQWQEVHPSTMHAVIHDQKYLGFYSYGGTEGCIVLDLKSGDLTTFDFYVDAAYVDPQSDKLYVCRQWQDRLTLEGGGFVELEGGGGIELEF